MSNFPDNEGKPWTAADDAYLRKEAKVNTPTRLIGLHLGRTEDAIYKRASQIGLSLKPVNQSPYGTKTPPVLGKSEDRPPLLKKPLMTDTSKKK